MTHMARLTISAFAALITAAAGLGAQAADYAPTPFDSPQLPAVTEPQLEFGSSWYLRGDVGWTRVNGPILSSDSSFLANNKAKNAWAASAGFGYKINDWFRSDLTGEYHMSLSTAQTGTNIYCPYGPAVGLSHLNAAGATINDGIAYDPNETCSPVQGAKQNRAALLLNGYIDLGNWRGVTPYVGAGAGLALIRTSGGVSYFRSSDGAAYTADLTAPAGFPLIWINKNTGFAANPAPNYPFGKINFDRRLSRRTYNFAWALMAGFAYDISDRTKLDIGYRYENFGTVAGVAAPNSNIYNQKITVQEVRVGLRYMID